MRLNPKVVVLYIAIVALFAVTFGVISEYGSRTLAAPPAVSGTYMISSQGEGTPDCFGGSVPPLLVIGQSGRYLNADFVSDNANEGQRTRFPRGKGSLNGQIRAGLVRLESPAATLGSCMTKQPLTLEATIGRNILNAHLIWEGKRFSFVGYKKVEIVDLSRQRSGR